MELFRHLVFLFSSASPMSALVALMAASGSAYLGARAVAKLRARNTLRRQERHARSAAVAECTELVGRIKRAALSRTRTEDAARAKVYMGRIAELIQKHRLDHLRDLGVLACTLDRLATRAATAPVEHEEHKRRSILSGTFWPPKKGGVRPPDRPFERTPAEGRPRNADGVLPKGMLAVPIPPLPVSIERIRPKPIVTPYDAAVPKGGVLIPVDEMPELKFDPAVIQNSGVFAPTEAARAHTEPAASKDEDGNLVYVDQENGITVIVDASAFEAARLRARFQGEKTPSTWDETIDADGFIENAFSTLTAK